MLYFDKKSIDKGRKNTMVIIVLFSILYSLLFTRQLLFSEEGISILNIATTALTFFILYRASRGSEKAYFYIQVQIFALIGFAILMILFFIYDVNSWIHELNYIILLIPCVLGSLGIPMIFMIKSKFMGDIDTYLAYCQNIKANR